MAAPYAATSNPAWLPEVRSATPAMNNSRYTGQVRYGSAPRQGVVGGADPAAVVVGHVDPYRSMTPNRFIAYENSGGGGGGDEQRTPSSTGLIRLSLKKPMGIVFEPMYDPNKPTDQRGVRICDLPRTGAAALSRKLQVGDELLQINDTTVSRLTFDEIMDFIIEADPDSVNLLFRRPRKETLQARQGVQQKLNAVANKDAPNTVKWVDEERGEKKKQDKKEKKKEKNTKRSKKESTSEEEETLQSSTADGDSLKKDKVRTRKKTKSRRNPVESESFLDMLIDSICADSSNMCRDTFRRHDDEYGTDDDESFGTTNDEETYATYEESIDQRIAKKTRPKQLEENLAQPEIGDKHRRQKPNTRKEKTVTPEVISETNKKYEDDVTLETVETTERLKNEPLDLKPVVPLGLVLNTPPSPPPQPIRAGQSDTEDDGNPAPIRELEYDDRIDHGADVSVMESLGGPSLLIEKQRAAQAVAQRNVNRVPTDIIDKYGLDFQPSFGMPREQAIQADPLKFYSFVVRRLLEDHEPEKVRLLDKLLAKYKGREDHLIQKLVVRYNKAGDASVPITEENEEVHFTDAVKKGKTSSAVVQAVNHAREIMHHQNQVDESQEVEDWPDKETKEQDEGDEESETESEYSRESVDGTSPAVIAQVSDLLNYVYGKTTVAGQIDRVSTIMRAYENREAVLLELLETKALIKNQKEAETNENLPSYLRKTQYSLSLKNDEETESDGLPPVTPLATQAPGGTVINDDISSMSGVSSPAVERDRSVSQDDVAHIQVLAAMERKEPVPVPKEALKQNPTSVSKVSPSKPPATPDKRKKKGLFGGLFGGKKKSKEPIDQPNRAATSIIRTNRKIKGVKSIEGSI
jgi:PDZ domain